MPERDLRNSPQFNRRDEAAREEGMAPPETDLAGSSRADVARMAADAARKMAEANRASVLSGLAARGYQLGSVGWEADTGRWEGVQGATNRARINLQDKMIPMREAQADIEKSIGSSIPDAINVYMGENLMHGEAGDAMRRLQHGIMDPITRRMRNLGISSAQMQDYLLARHAPERNARVAQVNPALPDAGSGITTQNAQDILSGKAPRPYSGKVIDPTTLAKIEQIAPLFDKLRAFTLNTLEKSGQITPQAAAALRGMFEHYAPLRGKSADDDEAFAGLTRGPSNGRGLSALKVGIKRALGCGEGNLTSEKTEGPAARVPVRVQSPEGASLQGPAQRSVRTADDPRNFSAQEREGKLCYLDQKTSPEVAARSGLQLPGDVRQLRGCPRGILTERGLVKWKEGAPDVSGAGYGASKTTLADPMRSRSGEGAGAHTSIAPSGDARNGSPLCYLDQKTSPEVAARSGLQLPGEVRQLRGYSHRILPERDLRNSPQFNRRDANARGGEMATHDVAGATPTLTSPAPLPARRIAWPKR